jgi:hypothetical protein
VSDLQRDSLLSSLRGRAREHDIAQAPENTPDQALVALRRRARQIRPVEPAADAAPAKPAATPVAPVEPSPRVAQPAPAVLEHL